MKKIFYTFLLISPILFIISCEKDEAQNSSTGPVTPPTSYVLYEGNYYDIGSYSASALENNLNFGIRDWHLYDFSQIIDTTLIESSVWLQVDSEEDSLFSGNYSISAGAFFSYSPDTLMGEYNTDLQLLIWDGDLDLEINYETDSLIVDFESDEFLMHYEGLFYRG